MSDTIFHLHWMRESASGLLDADLGTRVHSSQLEIAIMNLLPQQQSGKPWTYIGLPIIDAWVQAPEFEPQIPHWAWRKVVHFLARQPKAEWVAAVRALAANIRAAATAANLREADLYLPYCDRRIWNNRWELFPSFTFTPSFVPGIRPALLGRVMDGPPVAPFCLREMAVRAASSALLRIKPQGPLFFEWSHPAGLAAPWNAGIIERYRLPIPKDAPPIVRMTFTQREDGTLLRSWLGSPRERQTNHYAAFSRMSLAIQMALRRWVLATYASQSPDAFADFDLSSDILVYAATKPYTEKKSSDFSYDVLNPELMSAAFTRATRRLEPLLELAADTLAANGLEDAGRFYIRNDIRLNAPKLTQRANRRPRVRTMLVAESTIIYSLIRFANRIKLFGTPREITLLVDEMVKDFDERLRKLFHFLPDGGAGFAPLLFLEAANALHMEATKEQGFEVLAMTADGVEYRNTGQLSESLAVFS